MLPPDSWKRRLSVFAAALWWGSLTTIAFLVVPMLFAHLGIAAVAGQMAARLFSAQVWVALGCAMLLLFASRSGGEGTRMDWAQGALMFVLAGALLALLVEWGVAPRIVARENLKFWHTVGTALYALQWLCAGVTLWKVTGPWSYFKSAAPS
jgi:hypothetical protein